MKPEKQIKNLLEKSKGKSAGEIIQLAYEAFGQRITFATSLGEEDQVITDMIAKIAPQIEIFTLDTGRLHQETYDLLAKTQKKYNKVTFKVYFPDAKRVEDMVRIKGINLFYESIENRKLCCGIRKVEPLQRALKDVDAWITGLRRAQSVTRADAKAFEWDEANKKIKVNPLVDWNLEQVKEYIKKNKVDSNPLHAKGFISIGCAPCTRAVKPGEDIRAGRWWWEEPEQKECGLHNNPKRKKE
ncbi:MAG TPA: phosphoadenylyl-sulfate reductase [Candidatus Omnitrophota bacterium]|nr:phosphoadenylyl-sulfate reductase [Candidatus Omnitrophota bacterium]